MSHALALVPDVAPDRPTTGADSIVAAIARHRAAAVTFEKASLALDRVTTHPANQRTPMTIAAMARADMEKDVAGVDEQTAWEEIWALDPQTFGALMVASRYASDAGAERGHPDSAAVFDLIAKHLQRLIGTLPDGMSENDSPAGAEYMAAIDFEPYDQNLLDELPTAETWGATAGSHLVTIRLAGALLTKTRGDLHQSIASLMAAGQVGEKFLDDLKTTADWAAGLHSLMETAYTRVLAAGSAAALRDAAGEDLKKFGGPADPVGKAERPQEYVPGVPGAHPDAYGLCVRAEGAGLRAPPGSTVMVEPVSPTPNGLAVVYFKRDGAPRIYDLDRNFVPTDLLCHPDSTVFPLIELIEPISGRYGRVDVRKIDKMHRVCGVYQTIEVAEKYGPAVPDLPEFSRCPSGMIEHRVDCAAAYPILRIGEIAIADPTRREPRVGGLFLIEWNNGSRTVLTTDQRDTGSVKGAWWVDPVNRPRTRELLEMRMASGAGPLFTSDGPYDLEQLQEKIVGEVVGVLVPGAPDDGERQAVADAREGETSAARPVVPHPGEQPSDFASACAWSVRHRAWIDSSTGPDTDEALDAEMDKDDQIFARGIATPAADLRDLWGKAQLALEDLQRFHIDGHEEVDDGVLLIRETLRDAIRLCEPPPSGRDAADDVALAIEGHREAWAKLTAASTAADEIAVRDAGGDTSPGAMGFAEAARDAVDATETRAWHDLLGTRPTNAHGLLRLLRYVSGASALEVVGDARPFAKSILAAAEAAIGAGPDEQSVAANGAPLGGNGPLLHERIIGAWREWGALPDFDGSEAGQAELERIESLRDELLTSAAVLPATQEYLPVKTLAAAWSSYSDQWRNGWARDRYNTDGRLVLDIDTAICGRLKTTYARAAA